MFTTPSGGTPPGGAPTVSVVGCNSLTVNWNSVSGATSYILDVSTSNSFSTFVTGYNGLNVGNSTSRAVEGLSPGTTYWFRVRAVSSSGTSVPSTASSATTQSTGCGGLVTITFYTEGGGVHGACAGPDGKDNGWWGETDIYDASVYPTLSSYLNAGLPSNWKDWDIYPPINERPLSCPEIVYVKAVSSRGEILYSTGYSTWGPAYGYFYPGYGWMTDSLNSCQSCL
jgi:hypothetical protein